MKLRNQKTGEVCELFGISCKGLRTFLQFNDSRGNFKFECESLAELNDEWEDYEEATGYWYIDIDGEVLGWAAEDDEETDRKRQAIGNYFETKEEAERAVEKLKAWKRLKDKGYRVRMNNHVDGMLYLRIWNDTTDAPTPIDKAGGIYKDLNLLFGGEDE